MSATIDRTPVAAQPVSMPPRRGGAVTDPRWARPALLVLLAATGVLYLWNLSASGWANSYYAAAVQAGSQSWTAWFFGSLDAGNAITVDKPPASLWVMGLSARLFGFSSWSMLAPQALAGVASVGVLYAAVKRWSGPVAGLVAGAALALTPAAALMFRFNNPDALLTLLLVVAAYCLIRAMDAGATARRWVVLCGAALGFAFLAKMLQGFLVVPGFALTYLIAAPTTIATRVRHTLLAGASMLVSAGWYVAVVELWPASARPYIGGSTNNSLLDLVLGYNGLSRITGGQGGSPGGAGGSSGGTTGGAFGGATGLGRLFGSEMGVEVSWLLPAALLALGFGLWTSRRAPRTDRTRAALLLWGTWLLVTGLVFSYMSGVVHPYYTVALAPAVAALVAVGGRVLWQRRESLVARIGLAAVTVAAGGWGYVLLARNSTWHPELRYAVLAVSVLAALGLVAPPWRLGRRAAVAMISGAVLAGLAAPASYAVVTAATAHSGSIPTVGPAGASGSTDGMGGGAGNAPQGAWRRAWRRQRAVSAAEPGRAGADRRRSDRSAQAAQPGGSQANAELTALLQSSPQRWAAATSGAQSAASLELASGASVIGIGGFTGSDPAPTLAQFQEYVAQGLVHYFVVGGQGGQGGQGGGPGGDRGSSSEIATWVSSTFTAATVGGATVYDLTAPAVT